MTQHLMVDLETLATTIDANVLTIGAIKFDPHADYRGWNWLEYPETQIFYRRIDPESGSNIGLRMDEDTLSWWSKQSDEVKEGKKQEYETVICTTCISKKVRLKGNYIII